MVDNEKYIEVHRYLTRQCDEEQKAELESWINTSDENKSFFNQINNIWTTSKNINTPIFDPNSAWIQNKEKFITEQKTFLKPRRLNFYKWMSAAASMIIVLAAWIFWPDTSSENKNYSAVNEVIKVTLQDESLVFLDKNSSIKTENFTSSNRHVRLEGKAIFDVTKRGSSRFQITSNDFKVIVLGTSFIVDTDLNSVKVIEGSVVIKTDNNEVTITTNQSAKILTDRILVKTSDTIEDEDLFFNHLLSFDNSSLNQVFNDLGAFFNTKFDIKSVVDSDKCKFTSGSLKENSLEEILQLLKITFGLEYIYEKNNMITIKNINCRHIK